MSLVFGEQNSLMGQSKCLPVAPSSDCHDFVTIVDGAFDIDRLHKMLIDERVLKARLEERSRLASELHDDIAQQVVALKINAQLLGEVGGNDSDRLSLINSLVAGFDNLLASIRSLTTDFHHDALNSHNLESLLDSLLGAMFRGNNIRAQLKVSGDMSAVGNRLALVAYRVAQEAVTNVAKHAHATLVELELHTDESGLLIRLVDNGVGYEGAGSANKLSGLGLDSMRRRASELGGYLTIESKLGVGTQVSLWLPVHKSVSSEIGLKP